MNPMTKVARYDVEFCDDLGNACYAKTENGAVVMFTDHESALAAKDARIAELERTLRVVSEDRAKIITERDRALFSLAELRTAIEAKAAEWKRRSDTGDCPCENPEEIYAKCAAELLEVKP